MSEVLIMYNLINKRDELQSNINSIDEMLDSSIECILNAIKQQQWYFLANNPKILIDRDTAIIWTNLNYFHYGKNNNQSGYSNSNNYSEVKTFMLNINSENRDGFSD